MERVDVFAIEPEFESLNVLEVQFLKLHECIRVAICIERLKLVEHGFHVFHGRCSHDELCEILSAHLRGIGCLEAW